MASLPPNEVPSEAPQELSKNHELLIPALIGIGGILQFIVSPVFMWWIGDRNSRLYVRLGIAAIATGCGLAAWVLSSNDRREIAAGRMDCSGNVLLATKVGRWGGMAFTFLPALMEFASFMGSRDGGTPYP